MLILDDSANPRLQSLMVIVLIVFMDWCISPFTCHHFHHTMSWCHWWLTHTFYKKEVNDELWPSDWTTICFSLLIVSILTVNRLKPFTLPQTLVFPITASFHVLGSQIFTAHTYVCTHKMHTYYSKYTHPTHSNCSSWSLTRQSVRFWLLSNISSSSHQPTVKSLFVLTFLERD